MCDVSPYVQPHDEADVRRADAMTKVDYADARKPSELSERAGEGGKHRRDKEDAAARRSGSDGSDGRRAMLERIVGELAAAGLLRWGDAP